MNLSALQVLFWGDPVGKLYQYGFGVSTQTWFVADVEASAERLSLAFKAENAVMQQALWASYTSEKQIQLRASGGRLPPFFQNLLPEGVLRTHIEQLRGCEKDDHFDMLAACGSDLPGAVAVEPLVLSRVELDRVVTQNNDALEASVSAQPLADAISISGVQPKLALLRTPNGRYVARQRDAQGRHIIAKLPTAQNAFLPEVEHLSLELARMAGVHVVDARLESMGAMVDEHEYDNLGEGQRFLAVDRFDRDALSGYNGRIHAEDFAQVLTVDPAEKYTHRNATYADVANTLALLEKPDIAIKELWRRLIVNDMLGNYDAHLKNFGLLYHPSIGTALSPAYDVVAYSAYYQGRGHALKFTSGMAAKDSITPSVLRSFANAVPAVPEAMLRATGRDTVEKAMALWPVHIANADIPEKLKTKILKHLDTRPITKRFSKSAI
jgi:serine/threonine-protein kinase HipA